MNELTVSPFPGEHFLVRPGSQAGGWALSRVTELLERHGFDTSAVLPAIGTGIEAAAGT